MFVIAEIKNWQLFNTALGKFLTHWIKNCAVE